MASLAALAVWLIVTLPGLGHRYAYEWDSVQFAMGAKDWDIRKHQPHPMGFPVWILMLKMLGPLMDPLLAQRVLSLGFTVAGLWVLRLLVREKLGETAALVATALVAWGPPVRMSAVAQTTYPVDFLAGGTVGWLALKAWRGEAKSAFLLPVAAALFAGVRSSTGTFLAPLVGVTLLVFVWRTRRWGVAAVAAAAASFVVAAWLLPTLQAAGGWVALSGNANAMFGEALSHTSMMHGATWGDTQQMMELTTTWITMSTIGLWVPWLLFSLLHRMWKPIQGETSGRAAAPLDNPLFYALWMGPTLLAIYLIHGPKPGYHLLVLPAIAIVASAAVWRAARMVVVRERDWALSVLVVGLTAAVGTTFVPYEYLLHRHYYWFQAFRATPMVHDDIDANCAAMFKLLDQRGPGAMILMMRGGIEGPNTRTIRYYRPQLTLASLELQRQPTDALPAYNVIAGGTEKRMDVLPDGVTEVLIVTPGGDPEWAFRSRFPLMRMAYKGPFMQLWLAPYR